MENTNNNFCKYCSSEITQESIFGNTIICNNCSGSYNLTKTFVEKNGKKIIIGTIVGLGLFGTMLFGIFDNSSMTKRKIFVEKFTEEVKTYSFLEAKAQVLNCDYTYKIECRKILFKRLLEFEPNSFIFKANYAFMLSQSAEHKKAIKIYKELIDKGEGTYDLLAYYATSLKAINKNTEAIKWFKAALVLNPKLVDATKDLGALLIQEDKPYQAASLLQSFVEKYPEARAYLSGGLQSLSNTKFKNQKKKNKIELIAISGGHHYLPIALTDNQPSTNFLIDTGATTLSMNTKLFNKNFSESLLDSAKGVRLKVADGRIIKAKSVTLKKLSIGSWDLKNIEVTICDTCSNLAGKSLLKNFDLITKSDGGLEFLTLTR